MMLGASSSSSVGITEPEETRRRVNVYNTDLEMQRQTLPSLSPNTCPLEGDPGDSHPVFSPAFSYMIEYHSSVYKDFPGRGSHSSAEINESGVELAEKNAKQFSSSNRN